ncbi:MAG: alpha/beta hydrolase [Rhodocyclaceae bacterium]|nr:alpha/beta hydrolase [Rhodocyclaceae bacterium]MBX3669871.1 alpha/beta hydrolase [Rhodocyclaceae bacterium]
MNQLAAPSARKDSAVLVLHDLFGNPEQMASLCSALERAGFAVHCPYMRAFGMRAAEPYSVDSYGSWISRVLVEFDKLSQRYGNLSLAGLGVGANLALRVAAERNRQVRAVVAMSCALDLDGWNTPKRWKLMRLLMRTPLRHTLRARLAAPMGVKSPLLRGDHLARGWPPARLDEDCADLPLDGLYQMQRCTRSLLRALPRVKAPVLVLHAREDDLCSLRNAEQVLAAVPHGLAQLTVFDDSYHFLTQDAESAEVARHAVSFLSESCRPPPIDEAATMPTPQVAADQL